MFNIMLQNLLRKLSLVTIVVVAAVLSVSCSQTNNVGSSGNLKLGILGNGAAVYLTPSGINIAQGQSAL
jgi:hypothetical protein